MYVIIDVGGTSMRIAASLDLRRIVDSVKMPTPKKWPDALNKLSETAKKLAGGTPLAVAMGVPGIVDAKTGRLSAAPNLPGWANRTIGDDLSKRLDDAPIWLENDTVMGGIGEATSGVGREKKIVAYIAIGTGLGGCRVIDGRPAPRVHGFEPGHMIIESGGRRWSPCGQRGCLEAYCSGAAFKKDYAMRAEDCTDKRVWNAYAKRLAQGIINVVTLWSPDIVILGGGFGINASQMLPVLRKQVDAGLKIFKAPPIELAALGDDAGLYGGMRIIGNI